MHGVPGRPKPRDCEMRLIDDSADQMFARVDESSPRCIQVERTRAGNAKWCSMVQFFNAQVPINRFGDTPSIPIGCNRLQSVATDREVWCGNGIKLKEGDTHHEITPTGEDNYLGVVIDGKLDFEKHINIKGSSISHRKIICITEWCKTAYPCIRS